MMKSRLTEINPELLKIPLLKALSEEHSLNLEQFANERSFGKKECIYIPEKNENYILAVLNKVHPGQIDDIQRAMSFIPILGYLPYEPMAVQADLTGQSLFELSPKFVELAKGIKDKIQSLLG
ncbi:MAG TPA: hypothetical protein VFC84_04830 [Desulfosporosinus sp.]|nr:hypothetical protein [Desulfosporosinus sp.]